MVYLFACTNLDIDWNVGHSLQSTMLKNLPFAYCLTILFKKGFPAFVFIKE